ncbi:MAG: GMC family oxidoreductase N-terminal domain-containing protein [Methylococcaceae bacterium]|nr:GMC family oxidoreductase N-terminal domain-containing protein [Methylococcaceae bacterium]
MSISYDVLVVGSGYGGGVAASRLARAGKHVCVFERGKEFQSGEYPSTAVEAAKEAQFDTPEKHIGPVTGLYDVHINEDINVVVGCGLGGTSLINANVSMMADPRVFDDECWPKKIRDEAISISSQSSNAKHCEATVEILSKHQPDGESNLLAQGYERAISMLKPVTYPVNHVHLPKMEAHQKSAEYLKEQYCQTPINVTFKDGVNHVGVEQTACTLCGDCVSGCNVGAKNTTVMNYLPDARNHGAEIYTEISVSRIAKAGKRWRVYYQPVSLGRGKFNAPEMFILTDIVVLAAGTLGSTEILLRSKESGLKLSDQLGKYFTGNGDVLAFGYNMDKKIDGIGFGQHKEGKVSPVGPCITSVIDARKKDNLIDDMVIEEGSLPGAFATVLPGFLSAAAKVMGKDTDQGFFDQLKERLRIWDSAIRGAYHGAVKHTQTYLVMAHDNSDGEMVLKDDRLRVKWEKVGKKLIFQKIEENLKKCTQALGGTYVPNPIWNDLLGHRLVTVHPLGGARMGESAEMAVVNHKSQVYSEIKGSKTHKGLYVCDGAIVPRSLGTNPLLTISALAERSCSFIAKDYGWDEGYSETSTSPPESPVTKLGIQFTEQMTGFFSNQETEDYEKGASQGQEDKSDFTFTLTVISDDLESLLTKDEHAAKMLGSVVAPALSEQPLTVVKGNFNLFVKDFDEVGVRRMVYQIKLTDEKGRNWFMHGYKKVHDDKGFDVWDDTTTLFITIYDGSDINSNVHGKGILKILPVDFAKQMMTMQARNAPSKLEAVEAVAKFGRFFAGVVYESYSGSFAPFNLYNPDKISRTKRPLKVEKPIEYTVVTEDNVEIRLTRYQGGDKGPVIFSHGLGVSSKIFSLDTIDTNLLEFVYAEGYDVWLLDYRASIELPASKTQFTADDIAKYDYPAAVSTVLKETGAESVQMVVHCFGSTTFFMSMLAGLKGVRSAFVSQIAAHIKAPILSKIKAGLHLPALLDTIGVDSLTAYVDSNTSGMERLYDNVLRLYPVEFEEQSNSPVDRRITFMYGQLWELDQLNTTTHETLHELFGVANMRCFEHLALMVRKGHLVAYNGAEIYMQHLDRLAIPITFIHGAENSAFNPKSTQLTYEALQEANGDLYERHVIADYGHIDCIFGKNAARDIYPLVVDHLEKEGG